MLKLLTIAVVVVAVAVAVGGRGLGNGADAVRDGVTSVLPGNAKGQGDEQDGDTEPDEPSSGSRDSQAGDPRDTPEPGNGSDP